ncbi:MAG: chemotaxis protein CheA [Planctomycetes bacterium]|nr:chemotaxis protein CheA [Planctomycetota bacterium]
MSDCSATDDSLAAEDGLLDEMLGDFLDESDEIVSSLNENLLKLDEWVHSLNEGDSAHCDDDLMNEMFRGAHSLKGLSGMLGLDNINTLTHKVENIFDAARNDQLTLNGEVVELIFQSIDKLTGMIDGLKDSSSSPVDCKQVLGKIEEVLQGADAEHVQVSAADTEQAFAKMQEEAAAAAEPPAATAIPSKKPEEVPDHFADIVDETEVSPKYLAIFLDESEEALDVIDELLMEKVSVKSTESLMIQCHKIKGSAASLGLRRATKLAHFMEDLLQELLQAKRDLTDEMTEAMLRCTEALRDYVSSLRSGETQTSNFHEAYDSLVVSQLAPDENPPEKQADTEEHTKEHTEVEPMSDARRKEVAASAPHGGLNWVVQVALEPDLPLPGLKASLIHDRLCDLGSVFYCDPPDSELQDLATLNNLTLGITTEEDQETIHKKLQMAGIASLRCETLQAAELPSPADSPAPVEEVNPSLPEPAPTQPEKSPVTEKTKKPVETLRVDIERLDHLMNLAGQLVINKARFSQIGQGLKRLTKSKQASHSLANVFGIVGRMSQELEEKHDDCSQPLDLASLRSQNRRMRSDLELIQREMEQFSQARIMINDLNEAVHQLDRVTEGIQKTIMDTRMVAIGPLFRRFKRVIRDITRSNGKDIHLDIRGENTELDKRMIDELGDPLIHMIRNCVDHGIESPEDREAAGKPRQGTVTLDAFHRGNSILIEIRDDGKGLDAEKIRQKAIDKGLLSAADAEKLTTHQVFQLIWEPGLSTAEKVTEVSGRGMGMDIVRTKIEEISGAVELNSQVGEGTTITIKLPLTLAILPSLLVEIEGDVIAMPVESVSEIVRINEEDLSTVHGMKTASVRDRIVSVTSLAELFCWNQPPRLHRDVESEEQSLVILGSDGVEVGLIADRLLGEEDIVIKSLAENYRNVEGIAGASILGDGRVSLILDVGVLLEMSAHQNPPGKSLKETLS